MDILNWIYLLKSKLVRTTIQDKAKDLVILGNNVSFDKRGDKYQSYGMTVTDFANQLPVVNKITAGTGVTISPTSGIGNVTINSSGGISSVTGTAPVVSSGGVTPAISMAAATTSVNGYLTSTNFNTFNNKQAALVSGNNIQTINGNNILTSGNLSIGGRAGVEVYQSGLTQNEYQAAAGSGITVLFGSSYPLTVSPNGNIVKVSAMFQGTQSVSTTRLRIYAGYNLTTISGATNIGFFDLSAANVAAYADTVLYEKTFRLFLFNGLYGLAGIEPFLATQGNDFTPQALNGQFIGDTNSIYYPYIILTLNQGAILHTVTVNYSR